MLSTKPVKNVANARFYYVEKEHYYAKKDEQVPSQWQGKGADTLGLSGTVNPVQFEALLRGQLPNGIQLGKVVDGTLQHRPGYDLTFSAPKSVSLLALVGKDERLLAAHQRAVTTALKYVERNCAQARCTQDGEVVFENTNNLIVATFQHDVSRACDPQLHTHCVTMNATLRRDGQWRSLASNLYNNDKSGVVNGFWERVRTHQRYLGLVYRAELAYEVKQCGYDIRPTRPGCWDIVGVDETDLTFFSKRRQDIEAMLKEKGWEGARAAAMVAVATRPDKAEMSREELHKAWRSLAETNLSELITSSRVHSQERSQVVSSTATALTIHNTVSPTLLNAVNEAIEHLTETKSVITAMALVNTVLQHTLASPPSMSAVFNVIDHLQQTQQLIPLTHAQDNRQFTTPTLLQYEQDILQHLSAMQHNRQALLKNHTVNTYSLQHDTLTREQRACLQKVFTSTHQVIAIEGSLFSGKVSLYQPIQTLAKAAKHTVIVLTQTRQIAEQLKTTEQLQHTDTVHHFIAQTQSHLERMLQYRGDNVIIMIHDAQTLSTKHLHDLMSIVAKTGLRLIPVFDQHGLLSMGKGAPLLQMQQNGMETIAVSAQPSLSQTQASPQKAARALLAHDIQSALQHLQGHVIAIEDNDKRWQAIASRYCELPPTVREHTRVIMPTRAQCEAINQDIHQQLVAQGDLSKQAITVSVLLPRHLTRVQRRYAKHYKMGQWVRFHQHYRSIKIKRDHYYRIHAIQAKANVIILDDTKGQHHHWDPQRVGAAQPDRLELFDEKRRTFRVGEQLMAVRNVARQRLHNHDRLTITAIDGDRLTVTNHHGKTRRLNITEPEHRHIDYGYAVMAHQQQQAVSHIIAYQGSRTRLSSQRHFYHVASQASTQLTLYTDDIKRYVNTLANTTGDQCSVIERVLRAADIALDNVALLPVPAQVAQLEQQLQMALTRLIQQFSEQQTLKNTPEKTPDDIAKDAVQYALACCTEREAAFTHKAILQTALEHVLGDTTPEQIEQAIQTEQDKGGLIRGTFVTDGTRWTTPAALERERFILSWASQSKGECQLWCDNATLADTLKTMSLRDEQREAVRLLLTNCDRLVAIQGAPGTGKTTVLHAMMSVLKQANVNVQFLAPTHSAVKELNRGGLNAMTLQQFIADHHHELKQPQDNKQIITSKISSRLVIIDEASFVSNRQMKECLMILDRVNARVVLVGDRKQIPAIEAGKPQTLLEWHGVKMAYLRDIQRQRDPQLLQAVKTAYAGEFAKSFKLLSQSIVDDHALLDKAKAIAAQRDDVFVPKEVDPYQLRIQAIVEAYEKNPDSLVMTLTNADRKNINDAIRQLKIARGELTGEAIMTTVLVPVHLTHVERSRVKNLDEDNILRFNVNHKLLGIQRGEYWQIQSINTDHNVCTLQHDDGRTIIWQPPPYRDGKHSPIEVYDVESRELQVGDRIRWTRSNKMLGLLGSDTLTITAVNKDKMTVQTNHKRLPVINVLNQEHQHWDHAYAVTVHFAQGKTQQRVIALAPSYVVKLANQPNFLVMISRAVTSALVITDNKHQLLKRIKENAGEKISALETVGEIRRGKALDKSIYSQRADAHHKPLPSQQSSASPVSSPRIHRWNVNFINEKLTSHIEMVLDTILGEPKAKRGVQYRYGTHKGSLFVTVTGEKAGWWHDFQTDEGGRSLLSLIQRETGYEFKRACEYAASLLGLSDRDKAYQTQWSPRFKTPTQPKKSSAPTFDAHQRTMIRIAKAIARGAKPAKGTLVETYLREQRGITASIPSSLYYHPNVYVKRYDDYFPAMLVKMHDKAGNVQSIHLTLLDSETGNKANVDDPKLKFGLIPETISFDVSTTPTNKQVTFVAEGIETALSLASAFPQVQVKATLDKSGFKRLNPNTLNQHVVLCLDNDLKVWREDRVITKAAKQLVDAGKSVSVAMPEAFEHRKTDFNDVLQYKEINVIVNTIQQATCYSSEDQTKANVKRIEVLDNDSNQWLLSENNLNVTIQISNNSKKCNDIDTSYQNKQITDNGMQVTETTNVEFFEIERDK